MRRLTAGDHGFKPRKTSGRTVEEHWQDGIDAVDAFVKALPTGTRRQ